NPARGVTRRQWWLLSLPHRDASPSPPASSEKTSRPSAPRLCPWIAPPDHHQLHYAPVPRPVLGACATMPLTGSPRSGRPGNESGCAIALLGKTPVPLETLLRDFFPHANYEWQH